MMKPRPAINNSQKQILMPKQQFTKTTKKYFTANPQRHNKCSEDLDCLVKTIRVSIEKSE
jgi:hypothetical protein